MEKNCEWHFVKEGGRDIGPNDPVDEKFKGKPYYSIVREAIQNSLDAVLDHNEPVKVEFDFFNLNRLDYPDFFKIEENINLCSSFYPEEENAKRLFDNMLHYLNGNEPNKKKLELACLKIGDYNTRGMSFDSENTNSPFYAFLRAGGVSAKSLGAGGSFGFGKGAYYTLSPIKTIMVSTRDEKNNVFFEGSTILTTHKDEEGNKLTAYGYYDNNEGNPTEIEDNIPEIFRRNEIGTDVNIIGLWNEPKRKKLMVESVLNNFWLAIHENQLIVKIDDVTISSENLERIIDEYFPNKFESGSALEIESWNPKPYFRAVKNAKSNEQYQAFEENLKTLGKVKLYIYLEKGLPNRTSYFRSPKMVVYKQTNKKIMGYAAVFVCENEKGNEILRQMENPAHNEWKKENYPKTDGKIDKIARKAENEISKFINDKLDELSKINRSQKVSFLNLEDYLSIPEDLLEKEEEMDFEGEAASNISGKQSDELSDEETGMQTTTYEPVKLKPTIKIKPELKAEEDALFDEEGEEKMSTGGENETEGGDEPGEGEGETSESGTKTNDSNSNKILVKVGFKVAAQKEQEIIFHHLIITAYEDIANAELELLVGADNDKNDGLQIKTSDKGSILENKIQNVVLEAGKNKIKIGFADNLKHSIKIKAYEIQ